MKYLLSFCLILTACASYEVSTSGRSVLTKGDYVEIIEQHTDKARKYSGFYNTIDIEGTAITSEVAQAQLDHSGMLSQWDDTKFNEEKVKSDGRLNKQMEFFLSFFTPERKNDDLSKSNTIWKIFLDVDGRRFEGKATKIKQQLVEVEALYPYHNRFYTPYSITFPVSTRAIENKPMKLTITGAVGSATLKFNSKE